MMPVNLLIVRHGESLGNLANRMRERGDLSLADRLPA
jgi:broad specificity phosphatase PhoE